MKTFKSLIKNVLFIFKSYTFLSKNDKKRLELFYCPICDSFSLTYKRKEYFCTDCEQFNITIFENIA